MKNDNFVIVPCLVSVNGKFVHKIGHIPAGYHHLLKVYKNGSYMVFATFFGDIDFSTVEECARLLTDGSDVQVNHEFYTERNK